MQSPQAPLLLKPSDPCCFKVGFMDGFFVNIFLKSRYGQREKKKITWFTFTSPEITLGTMCIAT